MRPTLPALVLAAACAGILGACGGSSGSVTPASSSSAPAAGTPAPGEVGGKQGFTAAFVCDAVSDTAVEAALGSAPQAPSSKEVKDGINVCAWVTSDGTRAVGAVVYDDAFDKNFRDDGVAMVNETAGTSFETAASTTLDVGSRNVTVYGFSASGGSIPYAKLSTIANEVNDAIVDADNTAR